MGQGQLPWKGPHIGDSDLTAHLQRDHTPLVIPDVNVGGLPTTETNLPSPRCADALTPTCIDAHVTSLFFLLSEEETEASCEWSRARPRRLWPFLHGWTLVWRWRGECHELSAVLRVLLLV